MVVLYIENECPIGPRAYQTKLLKLILPTRVFLTFFVFIANSFIQAYPVTFNGCLLGAR